MGFCGKNRMFLCRQNPRQFCCTSKFVISMEKTESRGQWYPTSREKRARYGAPGVRGGGRKSGYAIATGVLMGWRAPKLMKTPSVQRPLFMEPSPSPLSSRPKRTQISYLSTHHCHACGFPQEKGAQNLPTPPSSTGNLGERSGGICSSAEPSWKCFSTERNVAECAELSPESPLLCFVSGHDFGRAVKGTDEALKPRSLWPRDTEHQSR